jgi:FdhE protein
MPTPILEPGQIEAAAGEIPELRIPPVDLFGTRARRLRQLAGGHALGNLGDIHQPFDLCLW